MQPDHFVSSHFNVLATVLLIVTGCGYGSTPEVQLEEPEHPYTSERGDSVQIIVTLAGRPTHEMDVWAVSSDLNEARVSHAISFDRENWSQPQYFTISGVDDGEPDGDRAYGILIYACWHDDPVGRWLVDELYFINQDDELGMVATMIAPRDRSGAKDSRAAGSVRVRTVFGAE